MFLYGSESWTLNSRLEKKLGSFHRHVLWTYWMEKVLNTQVLEQVGIPSMQTGFGQWRLWWLGPVPRTDDGKFSQGICMGSLLQAKDRPQGLNWASGCVQVSPGSTCRIAALSTWKAVAQDHTCWEQQLWAGHCELVLLL